MCGEEALSNPRPRGATGSEIGGMRRGTTEADVGSDIPFSLSSQHLAYLEQLHPAVTDCLEVDRQLPLLRPNVE